MKPWGPRFSGPARPAASDTAMAVRMRTVMGITRDASPASFTSLAWIFFPRYSGVRPIISPPMNTAMMA